jgi:excisionase family DNA binding protein
MDSKGNRLSPLLTVAEAATVFCVCQKTIRSWIKNRVLTAQRIGRVVRIRRSDIEKLIGGAE